MIFFYNTRLFFLVIGIAMLFSCKPSINNNPDHEFQIRNLLDSTRVIIENRKLEQGFHFLDSSVSKITKQSIGDKIRVYNFKQRYNYWAGRDAAITKYLNKSLTYSDSIINLVKANKAEDKYRQELALALFNKGDVFLVQKKYEACYQNFHRAKQLINKKGTACENARFNGRFAYLNYLQGNYKQAASFYMQEYKDNFKCTLDNKIFGDIPAALNNAGLAYLQVNMLDSAMICFKQSLNFIAHNEGAFPVKKKFAQSSKGVSYQYMGDVYAQNYDYLNAELYFKKSIEMNSKLDANNAQAAAIKLSKIYLATQNYKEAKASMVFLNQSINSNSTAKNKLDYKKLQIDYLNQTGNYKGANQLLPSYLIQKENFYADERNSKTIDAQTTFYKLQKDYDLNLLRNENKLRNLYLIISMVFLLMLFLILYQVWRSWLNSKRNNHALIELNKQVTEQNLSLQEALMALEQSEQENEKIMKIIAHDLRSPIGAIVNLAGLLEEDLHFSHEEKRTVSLIKISATDSIRLINDLLNREGADKFFAKEPVELNGLLKYCISLLKYKAEEKNQIIEFQSKPIIVDVNREKIWRVVTNLITNAIKFSKPNEKIKIWLKSTADKVLISVSDNGIGIPDDMKSKIFSADADVKRAGTAGEKSYGIGLLISKQIVEAHGGSIWFESYPEVGTTFFVNLPIN